MESRRLSVGAHRRSAPAPGRPSVPPSYRYRLRFFFRSSAISLAVFRLWQRSHRLWWLAGSMNNCQSPRWGSTWSTTVAQVRTPRRAHSRQNGSRKSCAGRRSSVQTGRLYQLWYSADVRRAVLLGLCLGQYPSRVSNRQPGCRHGLRGFKATGYHLRAKQKAPKPTTTQVWVLSWLRRWSLWTRAQALRYSRVSPARSACTFGAGFGRWCPAGSAAIFPCRIPGR